MTVNRHAIPGGPDQLRELIQRSQKTPLAKENCFFRTQHEHPEWHEVKVGI
jgi:hypothetical protein